MEWSAVKQVKSNKPKSKWTEVTYKEPKSYLSGDVPKGNKAKVGIKNKKKKSK